MSSWPPPCSTTWGSSTRRSAAACSPPMARASASATSWRVARSRDRSPTCCASRTTAGCSSSSSPSTRRRHGSSTTPPAPGTSRSCCSAACARHGRRWPRGPAGRQPSTSPWCWTTPTGWSPARRPCSGPAMPTSLRALRPQRAGERRGRGATSPAGGPAPGGPPGARGGARHAGTGRTPLRPVGRWRDRHGPAGDRAARRRPASGVGGDRLREPRERPRPGRPGLRGRVVDRARARRRPPRRTKGSRVAVPDVPGDVQGVARRPRRRGRPAGGHRARRGAGCLGLRRPWLPQHGRHAVPAGDDEARALAATTLDAIGSAYHPQLRGELLRYVQRAGGTSGPCEGCPLPYALALAGDFRGAADVWKALDYPFEQALDLADVSERRAAAEAVSILDRLGAHSAAERVRDRMRRRSA
jgi:hypothetical protein